MTEITLLRLASVPSSLVQEIKFHSERCPVCRAAGRRDIMAVETRLCPVAEAMVERCVKFEMEKRHHPDSEQEKTR